MVDLVVPQHQFDADDALRLTLATTDAGVFLLKRRSGC